LRIVDLAGS